MVKVVGVTGEGPTDYGREVFDEKTKEVRWEWGPVKNLLDHCVAEYGFTQKLEFTPVQKEDIKAQKRLRSDKGLKGLSIPARKFKNYCRENHLLYGIFYADADTREGSAKTPKSAERHYREVYNEVSDGLEMAGGFSFIPMIPLKMIECWLLADADTFTKCYGIHPPLPKYPELIWGSKAEESSDYPKNYLKKILSDITSAEKESGQRLYARLAENVRVSVLREKCEISFETFYQDFGKLLKSH